MKVKTDSVIRQVKPLPAKAPGMFIFYCETCLVEWTQKKYEETTCCCFCNRSLRINPGQKKPQHENAA